MKTRSINRIIFYITAGFASLGLIILLILFMLGGGFIKQTYLEPWDKNYASQFSDPRVQLTAYGLLAANNHNMQPWKIKLDKADNMVFYLYADSSRVTGKVDPIFRQMMITQGTFLEYVRIAGEKNGWNTLISLFPDGVYDESDIIHSMDKKPVAKITLSKTQPSASALYNSIFIADTNREAYKAEQLTSAQISSLEKLSSKSDLFIKLYTSKNDMDIIGNFAIQSSTIEAGVERVMEESNTIFRANEYQKNKYRYGYSVEGQGTTGFKKNLLQGLLTIFPSLNSGKGASRNFINYTKTSVDNTPAYAMIITAGNSRIEQVESGMLYSRLVLTGHTLGLAMQPLSQVLEEYPEMKTLYDKFKQTYAPQNGTVQMLFRVGKPVISAPLSMRQDVKSLIADN
jgi:hypothetical protein